MNAHTYTLSKGPYLYYVRQQKDWGEWVHKMAFFPDCYINADLVGGSDKVKRITVVI